MKKQLFILLAFLGWSICVMATDWTGTGWALNDGYVVTNNHVVDEANSIVCKFQRGGRLFEYDAEVVAVDQEHDLALIHITAPSFPGFGKLPYAVKTSLADVGESVFVLGYPLTDTMGDEIKLTTGIISSHSGYQGDQSLYQISAPIQPGNSGGPMFDDHGNVVGIVCAMHTRAENANYAVKTSYLATLVRRALGSVDILPTENELHSLSLPEKVKRVKELVCYIECSTGYWRNPFTSNTTPSEQTTPTPQTTPQSGTGFSSVGSGSRAYIREQITKWGECRNVALTKTNGDLAIHGRNGWAGFGLPELLSTALTELNKDDKYITDVQLTENGNWIVLYGNNGFRWSGIPKSLEDKIRDYNARNEEVTSVTFNDSGDWIVITTEHYASSDANITAWLKEGAAEYGMLWAACVTEDGLVACYEKGYKFYGEIPSELRQRLSETDFDVYRIKIAGDAYFFADKEGHFHYKM
ncbi:MAG: trypsin-like peptidase domain-containing protein [Paludibacteraceae bacterium]|nr:trypsin-like peptidase domain-containing protein [Paludibacteraceae bacterium]